MLVFERDLFRWATLILLMALGAKGVLAAPQRSPAKPAGPTDTQLHEIVQRLRVLPTRDYRDAEIQRSFLTPETYWDLEAIARSTPAQLNALAASDDGRSVSVALYGAWQRGDSRLILDICRRHLESKSFAVPAAGNSSTYPAPPVEQRMSAYVAHVLEAWFGYRTDGQQASFDKAFPGHLQDREIELWVVPWVSQGKRAKWDTDASAWRAFVESVRALPDLQRLVIAAALVWNDSENPVLPYRELLGTVSALARNQFLNDPQFLEDDPWFRHDSLNCFRKELRRNAKALLDP